jgi:hypothetical protein
MLKQFVSLACICPWTRRHHTPLDKRCAIYSGQIQWFLALGTIALVLNIYPRLVCGIPVRIMPACLYLAELFMTRTRTARLIGLVVLLLTMLINIKRRLPTQEAELPE